MDIYSSTDGFVGRIADRYVCTWLSVSAIDDNGTGHKIIPVSTLDFCEKHLNKLIHMKRGADDKPALHSDKLYFDHKYNQQPEKLGLKDIQHLARFDKDVLARIRRSRNDIMFESPYGYHTYNREMYP